MVVVMNSELLPRYIDYMKNSDSIQMKKVFKAGYLIFGFTNASGGLSYVVWDNNKKIIYENQELKADSLKFFLKKKCKFDADDFKSFQDAIFGDLKHYSSDFFNKYTLSSSRHGELTLNNIRHSEYHEKLQPLKGDADIDLLYKIYRMGDTVHFDGISFFEIALAHQIFHSDKIMAILGIYSEDRGTGKSTRLNIGNYLIDESNKYSFSLINASDKEILKWGDIKADIRGIVYDDIPNDSATVKHLEAQMKSDATQYGKQSSNIKGGGIKESSPFNQSFTTNSIYAIPLDASDDRRIYPIEIKITDYTDEDLKKIELLNIPNLNTRDRYYPIIQKELDHLYYVYKKFVNDNRVYEFLNKRVPDVPLKRRITIARSSSVKRFERIVETATNQTELMQGLKDKFFLDDDRDISFMFDDSQVGIGRVKNDLFLYITTKGLISLEPFFNPEIMTKKATTIHDKYFKSIDFKNQKTIGVKKTRSIRIRMKRYDGIDGKLSPLIEKVKKDEPNKTVDEANKAFSEDDKYNEDMAQREQKALI